MNTKATHAPKGLQPELAFTESFYISSIELCSGSSVSETSLRNLPNEELVELLRMRSLWRSR